MITIDNLAYRSKIRGADPKAKMFLAFAPIVLCIWFDDFSVSLITLFVMSFLTVKYSGAGVGEFFKYMAIPFSFLIISAAAVMAGRFPGDAELLTGISIGDYKYGVGYDTFYRGMKLAVRCLACLSCMYFFSFNTPMDDIFTVLETSRLPKVVVSLTELIYSYIFILLGEASRMAVAQKSRLGYGSFRSALYCVSILAGSLFIRAYDRAERSYEALASRGYEDHAVFAGNLPSGGRRFYFMGSALALLLIIAGFLEKTVPK